MINLIEMSAYFSVVFFSVLIFVFFVIYLTFFIFSSKIKRKERQKIGNFTIYNRDRLIIQFVLLQSIDAVLTE